MKKKIEEQIKILNSRSKKFTKKADLALAKKRRIALHRKLDNLGCDDTISPELAAALGSMQFTMH